MNINNITEVLNDGHYPAANCRSLGSRLGVPQDFMENVEANHRGNVQRQLNDILLYWLNNDGDASWNKLANSLERCNYRVLADSIRKKQKSGT